MAGAVHHHIEAVPASSGHTDKQTVPMPAQQRTRDGGAVADALGGIHVSKLCRGGGGSEGVSVESSGRATAQPRPPCPCSGSERKVHQLGAHRFVAQRSSAASWCAAQRGTAQHSGAQRSAAGTSGESAKWPRSTARSTLSTSGLCTTPYSVEGGGYSGLTNASAGLQWGFAGGQLLLCGALPLSRARWLEQDPHQPGCPQDRPARPQMCGTPWLASPGSVSQAAGSRSGPGDGRQLEQGAAALAGADICHGPTWAADSATRINPGARQLHPPACHAPPDGTARSRLRRQQAARPPRRAGLGR